MLVTCDLARDLDPDDRFLLEHLVRRGFKASIALWTDSSVDWSGTRLCLVRSTWDYHARFANFMAWIDHVERMTSIRNAPSVLRWSADKAYLAELQLSCVPVVPTIYVKSSESRRLADIRNETDWQETIIKPARGSAAHDVLHVKQEGDHRRAQAHLDRLSRSHGALVQPFLKSVATYGERALVFLDGQYSHAVIKKPFDTHMAVSDVKSAAVEATTEEIAVATKALSCVPGQPLFGRVDLLRGDCGEVYVSEVELVEPALYMRIHEPAVEILADAIERELSASAKTASSPAVTVG